MVEREQAIALREWAANAVNADTLHIANLTGSEVDYWPIVAERTGKDIKTYTRDIALGKSCGTTKAAAVAAASADYDIIDILTHRNPVQALNGFTGRENVIIIAQLAAAPGKPPPLPAHIPPAIPQALKNAPQDAKRAATLSACLKVAGASQMAYFAPKSAFALRLNIALRIGDGRQERHAEPRSAPAGTWKVYLVTTPDGKQYVGYTKKTLERRLKDHAYRVKTLLCAELRKHGIENCHVKTLATFADAVDAAKAEQRYIAELNTRHPHGLNRTEGGEGFTVFGNVKRHT